MASVDTLRRRVAAMRARLNRDWLPRTWFLSIETGKQLPPDVQAKIDAELRPNDRVFIRFHPDMGDKGDGWTWGTVHWHGGACIVKPDGSLEKVSKR